jgi:tRNA pseudouridine55 synthase
MKGEQIQLPPVYSAKLIDGKRAYQYARDGEEVQMRGALINIYDIKLEEFELPDVTLRITCSKGTYIRSIARDLGAALESGGYLSALRRIESGDFRVEDCYSMERIIEILQEK